MNILEKSTMKDGTLIQLEDWSEDYDFMPFGDTIAAYPKSKMNMPGQFAPKLNQTFRAAFSFSSNEAAMEIYDELLNGMLELAHLKKYLRRPDLAECI